MICYLFYLFWYQVMTLVHILLAIIGKHTISPQISPKKHGKIFLVAIYLHPLGLTLILLEQGVMKPWLVHSELLLLLCVYCPFQGTCLNLA